MGVIRVKCSKCRGTGDMGVIASCRCRVCGGVGHIELDGKKTALYDWLDGFLDPEIDEDVLEDQLRRILKHRSEFLTKKG